MVTGVAAYSKRLFTKCFLTLSLSLSLSLFCLFVSFSAVRKYVCVHLSCIRNAALVSCTTRQQPAYNQPAKKKKNSETSDWLIKIWRVTVGIFAESCHPNTHIVACMSVGDWKLRHRPLQCVCVYRTCRKVVANCVPAPSHTHTHSSVSAFPRKLRVIYGIK